MPTTNAQIAYQYFLAKGLTPAQAAGVVGNLQAESGQAINPEAVNSIGCVGIAQWCGGRRQPNLQTGHPDVDLQTQLDYIWYEMNGPEKRSLTAIKAATTPAQAAQVFEATFERSGGALLAKRQQYASAVYSLAQSEGWQPVIDFTGKTAAFITNPAGNLVKNTGEGVNDTVGGAVDAVKSTTDILGKAWDVLTNRVFWIRLGEILLGFSFLAFGLILMVSESKTAQTAATSLV